MMIWWSQQIFTAEELNTLISGSTAGGFDVRDLRENTVLSGGYQAVAGFSGGFLECYLLKMVILMGKPIGKWRFTLW